MHVAYLGVMYAIFSSLSVTCSVPLSTVSHSPLGTHVCSLIISLTEGTVWYMSAYSMCLQFETI
jgi:hypothetical protein